MRQGSRCVWWWGLGNAGSKLGAGGVGATRWCAQGPTCPPKPAAPLRSLNHIQLPKVKLGIAATATISFSKVALQPFKLGSGNSSQLPVPPALYFSLKVSRTAVGNATGPTSLRQGNLPWDVRYSSPSAQAISRSNTGIVFKPARVMTGKLKAALTTPTTYSFSLVFSGNVSIACADGYGGIDFLTPCTECKDLGAQSYSSATGSVTCSTCPGPLVVYAASTACGE